MFKKILPSLLLVFSFHCILSGQNSNEEFISIVKQYFYKKKYKAAINQLKFFIKKHAQSPSIIDALVKIGESYEKLGDYQNAIETYQTIAKKYAGTSHERNALFTIAYIYRNSLKQYDAAYAFYIKLKEKYLKTKYAKSVFMAIISVCEKLGKIEEGITYIDQLIAKFSGSRSLPLYYLPLKASFYIKLNNIEMAIKSYTSLISFLKSNSAASIPRRSERMQNAYKMLAVFSTRMQKHGNASKYYHFASEHAENTYTKNMLILRSGNSAFKAGLYSASIIKLSKVIKAAAFNSSLSAKASFILSECYKRLKNLPKSYFWLLSSAVRGSSEALEHIKTLHLKHGTAIKNKQYAKAHKVLISAFLLLKNIEESGNIKKIRNMDTFLLGLYLLSKSMIGLENISDAKEVLEKIIKIGGNKENIKKAKKILRSLN